MIRSKSRRVAERTGRPDRRNRGRKKYDVREFKPIKPSKQEEQ